MPLLKGVGVFAPEVEPQVGQVLFADQLHLRLVLKRQLVELIEVPDGLLHQCCGAFVCGPVNHGVSLCCWCQCPTTASLQMSTALFNAWTM